MRSSFIIICFAFLCGKLQAQNKPLLNGEFVCNQTIASAAGQIFNSSTASVVFVSNADTIVNPNYGINAGSVKFNNITLPKFNNMFYGDTTNSINLQQQHWEVTGTNLIPAMNFTITQPMPGFTTGIYNVASRVLNNDTLYKNDTLVVYLNNVQNTDSFIVSIMDGFGIDSIATNGEIGNNGRVFLDFVFSANGNELYILPHHLQTLHSGPRAILNITAANHTVQNIQGKNFKFKNTYSLMEANIYIKE